MKREKKVVMVIVEGPSDESAMGGILKEYFSSKEVQFAVVHGDITSDYDTTRDNVLIKIGNKVEEIRSRYGYHLSDFVSIIHIADTDGVFTKDCIKKSEAKNIQYYEDHIEVSGLWILISVIVGGNMFGVIGILLVVRCVTIIILIYETYILPWLEGRFAKGKGKPKSDKTALQEEVGQLT